MIRFLLGLLLIHLTSGQWNNTLRIVPRFTSLPSPVSYFTETAHQINSPGSDQLDLVCRAWPPNARVIILTATTSNCAIPSTATTTVTCSGDGFGTNLLPLPEGLGRQRYGFWIASQHPTRSANAAWLDSISHNSLIDAIRAYPAASPNDEVVVRLSVTSVAQVRQLESVRLHCLASTVFGQVLSPPFRVAVASLGELPGQVDDVSDGPTHTVEYLTNNIAAIECRLPAHSQPKPPLVSFELNDTLISDANLQSDKYRVVWRPDGQSVSLLIHGVQFTDWGTYRCYVTNPLTGEKKYSPESTLLKLNSPKNPVQARIMVPLASSGDSIASSTAPGSADRSQKIEVDEGQNVTLFCIIQGAPPPSVMTTAFAPNATDHNRFQTDRKFGLLQITNVQPRDSGYYVCSNRMVGSTALLHVKPRLRLTVQPENVFVPRLSTSAQFKCAASNQSMIPQWLLNGKPLALLKGTNLELSNVTANELGVYQCVVGYSMTSSRLLSDAEWVSSSAVLALQSDRVVQTATELSEFLSHSLTGAAESPIPEVTTSELTPEAQLLYDNLAASILWQPFRLDQSSSIDNSQHAAVEYRLEYSVETGPNEERPAADRTSSTHNPDTMAALVGLVGHAAIRWSDPVPLKQQTTMTVSYVTDTVLKPSRRYRFRVVPIDPSTGVNLAPPSGWSNVISTEHVSPVEPPQIKMVRPLANGRVQLVWTFDGAFRAGNPHYHPSNDRPQSVIHSSSTRLGVLEPASGLFVPDYFLILARPLVKPRADSSETFKYGAYWSTQVNGSMAREGILSGLNRSLSYQVVVYAARGTADRRQITRFSKAAYVNLAVSSHTDTFSLWRALTTNRLMYLILGGIAACMFLVVFVFILLCLCRQRSERRVTSQRKKQNGFVQGYKDASQYIPVSTMEHQTGGSGAGTISNQRATSSTPMMMMNNLQCSAFSDHSTSTQQQQQQHAQSAAAASTTINPMYPNDQYSAAMMNEMMLMQQQQQQQHHQSLMGSQMHLQQDPQLHRQHHQSHHSLLLPPAGSMFSPVPGPTGYQSGTLPGGGGGGGGGPRYVRQQFGSQQPLNRAMTPAAANMMDGTGEFYQSNVYAHHQPQLPPVPMHPQNTELPPMHGMSAGNPMHPAHQMVYYTGGGGGPMTPNNGSSMNREPPTGGPPLPDGSGYGTLLQRGQLTGSMINDRSSMGGGSMRPVSSHHPGLTYFHPHGSQQALHMMQQHANGMSSPQSALYSGRQQQPPQQQVFFTQPQYPGYFVQPVSQHPDAVVGHGSHGYGHTDGESIYSYFSQQDIGQPHHHQQQLQQQLQQPGSHQPLNPLPEENQMHPGGYVESGIQTNNADSQGNGLDGSPAAAGGSHRHHRRRRRKQPRQLSDAANGGANGGSGDLIDSGPPMSEQPGDAQLEDQRPIFENEYGGQKRAHSTPRPGGNYSDTDPLSGHQSFGSPQNGQPMHESARSAYTRYDSPPPRGQMPVGQLPPPNQPPPPPPPPGMGNGFAPNDHPHHSHPFSSGYPAQNGDSLSRRFYPGGPSATGGLVVGPPPRMRDYSEYGIPRGIGLPPPGQSAGQHNAAGGMLASPMSATPPVNGGPMLYTGRYREGQA